MTLHHIETKIFYMILKFSKEFQVTVRWIYLGAGHGKGIPDGVGALVRQLIKDIIALHPYNPIYNVEDLVKLSLQNYLTSITLSFYIHNDKK